MKGGGEISKEYRDNVFAKKEWAGEEIRIFFIENWSDQVAKSIS